MKGHYRRGAALFALEKYDDAFMAFKKAQELEPGNADIPKRLEEVSFERKRKTEEKLKNAAQVRFAHCSQVVTLVAHAQLYRLGRSEGLHC